MLTTRNEFRKQKAKQLSIRQSHRYALAHVGLLLFLPISAFGSDGLTGITGLHFLNQITFPIGYRYNNWQIDGLSGLDYDATSDRFLAVRDNAISGGGPSSLPPYFALKPVFSPEYAGYGLEFVDVKRLDSTMPSIPAMQGFESIRLDPKGNGVWLTSESPHTLYHLHADGVTRDQMSLPDNVTGRFTWATNNYGLEGLSFTPSGHLWVAREDALDGDSSSLTRLTRLNSDGSVAAQYAYRLDDVVATQNGGQIIANPPGAGLGNNGISELLALSDTRFLVMERGWDGISAQVGNTNISHNYIRIYEVDVTGATDVKDVRNLALGQNASSALAKTLIFNSQDLAGILNTYDTKIDNIEGMSFGPRLANGHPTVVLVSDSNNRWQQRKTQFLVLRIESPIPEAQYWDGATPMADGKTGGGDGIWSLEVARERWAREGGLLNDAWGGGVATFAGAPGVVTIDNGAGQVSAKGLVFQTGGYHLTGDVLALVGDRVNVDVSKTSDATRISSPITGIARLVKTGAGELILDGNNTYTGGTTVSAGRLRVNGQLIGPVDVANGAALAGAGRIAGDVLVVGTLSAGNPGTLSIGGSLSLTSPSDSHFELGAAGMVGGLRNDLVRVDGNLQLGGTLSAQVASAGYYRLFDYGGTLSGQFNQQTVSSTRFDFEIGSAQLQTQTAGQVNLSVLGKQQTLQFWDGADQLGNGTVDGGSGRWMGARSNWTGSPGAAEVNGTWGGSVGVFMGTGGSVTVEGSQAIDTLQFAGDGYRLEGGELRLQTIQGNAATINVNAGIKAIVGSRLVNGTASMLTKVGAGTLMLSNDNNYSGGTYVTAGTLNLGSSGAAGTGTIVLDSGTALDYVNGIDVQNALQVNGEVSLNVDTGVAYQSGALSGDGILRFGGNGTFNLRGNSSAFVGTTVFESGTHQITSPLGGTLNIQNASVYADGQLQTITTVDRGGKLMGNGGVGSTRVLAGGIIAPGHSPGTLQINGDLTLANGSTYQVEVNPLTGEHDLIKVSGRATLDGGRIQHVGTSSDYKPFARYTILSASGGVFGQFGEVASDFVFLTPTLYYGSHDVTLSLMRNDVSFASQALSANQKAIAQAVEQRGSASGLYRSLVQVSAAQALSAFDQLSGEIHASTKTALLEQATLFNNSMTLRLADPTQRADGNERPFLGWSQAFGTDLDHHDKSDAAPTKQRNHGMLVGIESEDTWRVGGLLGISRGSLSIDRLASDADMRSRYVGLYAGTMHEGLNVHAGISYGWHSLTTKRQIDLPDYATKLQARYRAESLQAFAEVSYLIHDSGTFRAEPFLGIEHTALHSDGFTERGAGDGLLNAQGQTSGTSASNLGARVQVQQGRHRWHGSLAWRHAFGDRQSGSTLNLTGAQPLTVFGTSIKPNTALLLTGIEFALGKGSVLSFGYEGQLAKRQTGSTINLTLSTAF